MAFLQTWTCDKCGHAQHKQWMMHGAERDMLTLSVQTEQSYYARSPTKLREAVWCHVCIEAAGIATRDQRKELIIANESTRPSLDDLIADIVGQVLDERGVGS